MSARLGTQPCGCSGRSSSRTGRASLMRPLAYYAMGRRRRARTFRRALSKPAGRSSPLPPECPGSLVRLPRAIGFKSCRLTYLRALSRLGVSLKSNWVARSGRTSIRHRAISVSDQYPGPGPIYRHCIMCGRPFRVWKCELLRNRAKFCTRKCYSASRRLFSQALADGRLELILASELDRTKAENRVASWRSLSNHA